MSDHPLDVGGGFGVFADALLAAELPDLPDDRRVETVAFVCRRARSIPGPLRLGVTVLSAAVGIVQQRYGPGPSTAFLRDTRLPVLGELARLVRSLGVAFVWETWPDTSPTGGPGAS